MIVDKKKEERKNVIKGEAEKVCIILLNSYRMKGFVHIFWVHLYLIGF